MGPFYPPEHNPLLSFKPRIEGSETYKDLVQKAGIMSFGNRIQTRKALVGSGEVALISFSSSRCR